MNLSLSKLLQANGVGATVGALVGETVGALVGATVGVLVGALVDEVGALVEG